MDQIVGRLLSHLPSNMIDVSLRIAKKYRLNKGRNIYDHEWDILVVLDGCRFDMYDRIVGEGDSVLSVASTSGEWMEETFEKCDTNKVKNTAYISANPNSQWLENSRFGLLYDVWENSWDDELGTIPPKPVTDHTIKAARSEDFDRIIAHYMQPHFPFIGKKKIGKLGKSSFNLGDSEVRNVWHMVDRGDLDPEVAIEAYYDNLRFVYDEVKKLLQNVDGKVVITADHGNALGEWNLWGHRAYVPFKAVREVPWDERICEDQHTYEPDVNLDFENTDSDEKRVQEHLEALGYVDE